MKPRLTLMAVVGMVGVVSMILQAATVTGPAWWVTRGTINTNLPPNDFAAVNQGQLKWMASNACEELEATLPGGAGYDIWALISSFTNTNNFCPVNLGQLKYVASNFCARLIEVGYATNYPWSGQANDYALANIGQMKFVFSFNVNPWLALDSDSDGMTNSWEVANGLNPNVNDANVDSDGDGLTNLQEYQAGTNPKSSDTDGDGMPDNVDSDPTHADQTAPSFTVSYPANGATIP